MLASTCHGNPTNPALVMLHGFLGSHADWDDLLPMLSQHFYCICIDLPGHGDSLAMTLKTPGFEQVANAIQLSITQLNIHQYHLLGYSLGGRISLHLAELYSKHILSLNLESAHPGLSNDQDKTNRLINDRAWSDKLCAHSIEDFLKEWYQQGVFAELSSPAREKLVTKRSHNTAKSLQSIYLPTSLAQQDNMWSLPNQVEFDCHYYVGDKDIKFSTLAANWQSTSAINVHTIENAGHNVHLAAPISFCQQLVHQLIGHH